MFFPPWPPGSPGGFLRALKALEKTPPRPGHPKSTTPCKSPDCYCEGKKVVLAEAGMQGNTAAPT